MAVRGVRGATTVSINSKDKIMSATKELLAEIIKANQFKVEDIASIFFTVTKDLNAEFPAAAARELGWNDTALLCSTEIDVPKSLTKCIRVLLHVNTSKPQKDIKNIYLKDAVNLRR